ncbi:hypothetical protein BDN70DRAFT_935744 [Pholiota conissans]|uniref:Uncharacterized protein n=1 Tax=Pholiota conissans TaxID=109636 RepID=A0A9P6CWE8_9AGAR|nr:hypothetical protein BDN70DRAFT_935744 [Pholiota conissans]
MHSYISIDVHCPGLDCKTLKTSHGGKTKTTTYLHKAQAYTPYTKKRVSKKSATVPDELLRSVSDIVEALSDVQQKLRVFSLSDAEDVSESDMDSESDNESTSGYISDASSMESCSLPSTPIPLNDNIFIYSADAEASNYDEFDARFISLLSSDGAIACSDATPIGSYQGPKDLAKNWINAQATLPSTVVPMYSLNNPVNYGIFTQFKYLEPDMGCDAEVLVNVGEGLQVEEDVYDESDIFSYLPPMPSVYPSFDAYFKDVDYSTYVSGFFGN